MKVEVTRSNTKAPPKSPCRVISITSGKGGVGKSNCALNLGAALADSGRSVLILDADLSLANLDILVGLTPHGTIADVLSGEKTLEQILIDGPMGITIVPATSGVSQLTDLTTDQRLNLLASIERVASRFDYLLIDTPAGIAADVLFFNAAAREVICVVTPEPTSLTDSYAMLKLLSAKSGDRRVGVIINQSSSDREAERAFERLNRAVQRYLPMSITRIGTVPRDDSVLEAVRAQVAVLERYPTCPASIAWRSIARSLDDQFINQRVKGGMELFFGQLLSEERYGS